MRIIAFVPGHQTVERSTSHIRELRQPPTLLLARAQPQGDSALDRTSATAAWPEMAQAAGQRSVVWE